MGWYKAKINPNDAAFSKYIRTRDGWKCVYGFKCGMNIDYSENKGGLDNSHFQKRSKWSVRYDPENCDAACKKCHYFIENHPDGQKVLEDFKRQQLGERRYNLLILRANTTQPRDDKMTKIIIKELMKELTQKPNQLTNALTL